MLEALNKKIEKIEKNLSEKDDSDGNSQASRMLNHCEEDEKK